MFLKGSEQTVKTFWSHSKFDIRRIRKMRISRHIFIYILIFVFSLGTPVYAQVVVERSGNKAVISGVAYYIHIVKKGETAYSVS